MTIALLVAPNIDISPKNFILKQTIAIFWFVPSIWEWNDMHYALRSLGLHTCTVKAKFTRPTQTVASQYKKP